MANTNRTYFDQCLWSALCYLFAAFIVLMPGKQIGKVVDDVYLKCLAVFR